MSCDTSPACTHTDWPWPAQVRSIFILAGTGEPIHQTQKCAPAAAQCELTKMHRRSACDPALESSRQRRQGELSQASIEVVHVEILMVAKTPGGPIKSVRLSLVLQRIETIGKEGNAGVHISAVA